VIRPEPSAERRTATSQLRKDPTRGRWVLVRPRTTPHPAPDGCPFCPGHESETPPEIAAYRKEGSAPGAPDWSVRVVPELDPYFSIERELVREGVGVYDQVSPRGASELIIESPSHQDTPATMPVEQWEQVVWMYRDRILDLKRDLHIRDILVTRRYEPERARIGHPYSRLTASPIVFDDVRRKLRQCQDYYAYKRRCIYCDIIREDIAARDRLIRLTDHFAVLSPYAARSAFETWILPLGHGAAYELALTPELAIDLAAVLRQYFATLARTLGDPPFEMALYTAPNVASKILPGEWNTIGDDYHWHLEVTLDRYRRARVGGIYINETPPEEAARRLRDAWE
jgi:UDPglucose--hexose-1-phosphate uridylyltransferase